MSQIKERKCPICKATFTPRKGQRKAHWTTSWCDREAEHLCSDCHEAARRLECLDGMKRAGVYFAGVPKGSDIAEESKSVGEDRAEALRRGESFFVWNVRHNPELYTEAEKEAIMRGVEE